jgi:hypothetical protein
MFKAALEVLKVVLYRANMGQPRKRKLSLIILSLALVSVPAGQAAYAAPPGSAPTGKVPSSGIGLAANLPERGVGVLPNSTYYERASKSRLWAQTPAGLVYRSCVYNVPSGSYVDSIHDRITLPNGRVLPMKPCPLPEAHPAGRLHRSQAEDGRRRGLGQVKRELDRRLRSG